MHRGLLWPREHRLICSVTDYQYSDFVGGGKGQIQEIDKDRVFVSKPIKWASPPPQVHSGGPEEKIFEKGLALEEYIENVKVGPAAASSKSVEVVSSSCAEAFNFSTSSHCL